MIKKEITIEGMSCMHCVGAVKTALKEFNPSELEVEIGKAVISFENDKVSTADLQKSIEEEGYKVTGIN